MSEITVRTSTYPHALFNRGPFLSGKLSSATLVLRGSAESAAWSLGVGGSSGNVVFISSLSLPTFAFVSMGDQKPFFACIYSKIKLRCFTDGF